MIKIIILLMFLLISCIDNDDNPKSVLLKEICYDEVIYLIVQHFSSVKFNKNGKIETCQ